MASFLCRKFPNGVKKIIIAWLLVAQPSVSNANENKAIAIYKFDGHGIGANVMMMLAHKKYFEEEGYTFKVDEHETRYMYNGKGFLSIFFSPKFEVIEDEDTLNKRLKEPGTIYETKHSKRRDAKWKYGRVGLKAYNWLSKDVCSNVIFNRKASAEIELYKAEHGLDAEFENSVSVGFHVRRGDAIREMRRHDAVEYVDRLIGLDIKEKIKSCFIASDDYEVIPEMKKALKARGVSCRVYSLVKDKQHGNRAKDQLSDDDVLQLMAEISTLTRSTYFIGSFDTNLGAMVSLMRRCYRKENKNHYHQSYGVNDSDDFRLK